MGKKIVIAAGLLALASWLGGRILASYHSPLSDFVRFLCFPFFTIVFLVTLFALRTRRSGLAPAARTAFRWVRIAVLSGIVIFGVAVFWPRSYGTPTLTIRPGTRYWDLPTGSRIAYTLIPGKGNKKPFPIICLHGGPGGAFGDASIRLLSPLADDGYDIYLYDQIGSGLSDHLQDIREYSAARHRRDLEAIVQQLRVPKVILMGHSWGAILAALYAADNPEKLDGLILTGPGPIYPIRPELARLPSPDSLHLRMPYYSNRQGNDQANNIRTRAMAFFATKFGIRLASDREADDFAGYLGSLVDRSTVFDTSRIRGMGPAAGAGYYSGVMTFHSLFSIADPRPKLRNSPIRLMVLKGQYDNQEWGYTHEYLELFPNNTLLVLPNAGHALSSEQPVLFLAAIRDFLKSIDK
ncbi:MAG TPA: alpha/beta hydrolase [Puia sp.]|jgi:proline iminopeptidase|nr:alpha/beta hydrolase [Puia sp.]